MADVSWIKEVVERYEGPLVGYAARWVGDLERGRDVVQEVFLRLCREERARVEQKVVEWLYCVCRNIAMDVRRKEGRMTPLVEKNVEDRIDESAGPAERVERGEEAAAVVRLVGCLGHREQEVVLLKFQHGLSYKEIAGVMNLSVSHVGVLLHTALKELRQHMESLNRPRTVNR